MNNRINMIPSFKRIHYIPDNKRTIKNNDDLFDTKIKKMMLDSEMRFLDKITGEEDIYYSNSCVSVDQNSGDKTFEIGLTNSEGKRILNGIYISKSEGAVSIKLMLSIMNEMVKQIFKEE